MAFALLWFALVGSGLTGELVLPASELAKGELHGLVLRDGSIALNVASDSVWNCARDIFGARALLNDKYEDELIDGDEKTYAYFKEDRGVIKIVFPEPRKLGSIRIIAIAQPELGKMGTVPADLTATYSIDDKQYREFSPAVKIEGNADEKVLISFAPAKCKYVKIDISRQNTGRSAKGGRIAEIELLGPGACGHFLSTVHAIDHRAFFERLDWRGKVEGAQRIVLQTRTADERDRVRFSPWTTHYEASASPIREKGRFLQVRGFLQSSAAAMGTRDPGVAELDEVSVLYDMPQSPFIVSGFYLPALTPRGRAIRELALAGVKYTITSCPTERAEVEMYDRSNLKIWAFISPQVAKDGWNQWIVDHPEIRMQNVDGSQFGGPCWNNPKTMGLFGQWVKEKVRNGIGKADSIIGGWYPLDEPMWSWKGPDTFCFCQACQQGYKQWLKKEGFTPRDLGFEEWDEIYLPLIGSGANYRNETHMTTRICYRDTGITDGYRVAKEAIGASDPKNRWSVPTTYVSVFGSAAQSGYDANQLAKYHDVFSIDWYPIHKYDEGVFKQRQINRWVAEGCAVAKPKPFGMILQSFGGKQNDLVTPQQWRKMCFQTIARGGKVISPFTYGFTFFKNEPSQRWHEMKREFNWLSDPIVGKLLMEAWPHGNIAILWPHPWTRTGRAWPPFFEFTEKHYSVEYITTEHLDSPERIAQYQAIYAEVPATGKAYEMSESRAETLRQYVRNGGTLITYGHNKRLPC
jgi:hypothetical protein